MAGMAGQQHARSATLSLAIQAAASSALSG